MIKYLLHLYLYVNVKQFHLFSDHFDHLKFLYQINLIYILKIKVLYYNKNNLLEYFEHEYMVHQLLLVFENYYYLDYDLKINFVVVVVVVEEEEQLQLHVVVVVVEKHLDTKNHKLK